MLLKLQHCYEADISHTSPLFLSTTILVENLLLRVKIFPVRKQRAQKIL